MGTFAFININTLIRRLRQEDHLEFKAGLGCTVKPVLRRKRRRKRIGEEERRQIFKRK